MLNCERQAKERRLSVECIARQRGSESSSSLGLARSAVSAVRRYRNSMERTSPSVSSFGSALSRYSSDTLTGFCGVRLTPSVNNIVKSSSGKKRVSQRRKDAKKTKRVLLCVFAPLRDDLILSHLLGLYC